MISSHLAVILALLLIFTSLSLLILTLINRWTDQILANALAFLIDLAVFHGLFDAFSERPTVSILGRFFARSGSVFCLMLVLFLLAVVSVRIFAFSRARRTYLSPFSMSRALNSLPTGILFATKDGEIFQTNVTMERLHDEITETPLRNAKTLWSDADIRSAAVYRSEAPRIFKTRDGRKWIFTKSILKTDFDGLREILALDVTRQVEMMEQELLLLKDYQHQSRQLAAEETAGAPDQAPEAFRLYEKMESDILAARKYLSADEKTAEAGRAIVDQFLSRFPAEGDA